MNRFEYQDLQEIFQSAMDPKSIIAKKKFKSIVIRLQVNAQAVNVQKRIFIVM